MIALMTLLPMSARNPASLESKGVVDMRNSQKRSLKIRHLKKPEKKLAPSRPVETRKPELECKTTTRINNDAQ